ncbi:rho GTPase-activating protein 21-B isoform X2 [Metopolophium dirhodum]|uniref:rho GTPase-activating protein 21-B isoform X2 n=1 Tax=Metopolophium dirhodum TaxID=44670 RepID=UPI00298FEDF9|nr:rho GTPase-activating protein 21-B isoform X2 [Metopolophium dirhodum]
MAEDVSENREWSPSTPGQNRGEHRAGGPRSLFIRRSENGFGFTLRHFIVYPPESYLVLAGDERLGLRQGAGAYSDEPMDTIFVKHVREFGPASVAGLSTGDRIISVNGETVAGKSYAHVVQVIQQTQCHLYLLVVPMENDILQLYFSETAHNPETNQRPGRLKAAMTSGSELRFHHRGRDSSPIYQTIWDHPQHRSAVSGIGSASVSGTKPTSAAARFVSPHRTPGVRRSSVTDTNGSGGGYPHHRNKPAAAQSNNPNARHSMDIGVACRDALQLQVAADNSAAHYRLQRHLQYGGASQPPPPVDPVIMSRIKKSLEQKEEFLRRPVVQQLQQQQPAKEFYARPQKLLPPMWPPSLSSSSVNQPQQFPECSSAAVETSSPAQPPPAASKPKGKQFVNTLGKIHEDGSAGKSPATAAETADHHHPKQTGMPQVVSMRAKQFESGKIDDKTDFYKSELARLTSKHNVPNVAVRKMEYEQKLYTDKKQSAAADHQEITDDSITSYSSSSDKSISFTSPSAGFHSGNLIVPIGSSKIHCDPPKEYEPQKDESISKDESYRFKPVVRQDSYLAACKKPTIIERRNQKPMENGAEKSKTRRRNARPTRLELPKDRPVDFAAQSTGSSQVSSDDTETVAAAAELQKPCEMITLRPTNSSFDNEEERTTRRISYLQATAWGDRMSVDDLTTTESESEPTSIVVAPQNSSILGTKKNGPPFQDLGNSRVVKEGSLLCKVIQIDGKKACDRSWKPVWAVVRGQTLCLYKEKRESIPNISTDTPATLEKSDDVNVSCDRINLRTSTTDVAHDYTKRKHVMRLCSSVADMGCTELLLQADDTSSMVRWLKALQEQALEAQAPLSAEECLSISPGNTKGMRKLGTFRNRSPTGDSPITKTRKPDRSPCQVSQPQSPKSTNTWKNRMAKQLKKIQQGSGSPVSPIMPTLPPPPGTAIGIPLELCPPSTRSEFVPLIVEVCTSIVEEKGLDIIGIYRVPGNTAAITSLTEAVNNGGMETPDMALKLLQRDPRWTDVNVISSLLKSFFRRLPDALLTTEMYPHFIEADKIDDPVQRMVKLRELVHKLPDHHFETLRYLLMHLKKVVHHSGVNKMEARNLAIVFGPTLVHSADDNMVTMVTDMSHQCRIVESLILQADWCFGNGDVVDLTASIPENCGQVPEIEQTAPNQNLLDNINKVSGNQYTPFMAKDLVTNIVAAANRKMHRATGKNSNTSRKSRTNVTNNIVPHISVLPSASDIKHDVSNKDKLNSSKASSETVSSTSLNESEDSLDHLTTNDQSLDLPPQSNDGAPPIKTYVNLAETTQERIRRFEQETKAMLQREINRGQRRREYFGLDEPVTQANEALMLAKDYSPVMVKVSKGTTNGTNEQSNDSDLKNNQKRLKTSIESTDEWSVDSLSDGLRISNERPISHASDEGGDLLVSLTSAFDKKLKSLLIPSDSVDVEEKQPVAISSDEQTDVQTYRDPSLHRSLERRSQHITEKHEIETMKDSTSESMKDSSKIDNFECLQDINTNPNVRLRRSESLKQKENRPDYGNHVKLRRCESLNKHERYISKYTKFEAMMLTKNGDASKHRRSDSLTKTEKTECNMNKRKQGLSRRCSSLRDKEARQKRKNGVTTDRSIKRRHTVGGTKDFDKITWLDNKEREELEKSCKDRRTSSPDLSWARVVDGIKERGIRPRSMADPNFVSKLLNVPLESHV